MELQSFLPAFEAAGVSLFVVFPEPVEQLATFAAEYDISVPLLADPDSTIIRDVGILNTTLTEDDAPFYGIPFPGSYVLDADGNVAAKFFEQNSLIRAHPDLLLRAATGEEIEFVESAPPAPPEHVEVDVALDAEELPAFLLRDLVVTLRVPAGQHLYGPPVSEGLVVTSVEIDDSDVLGVQPPVLPPTHPMVLEGTGETLHVYEGDVSIRVPVLYNAARIKPDESGALTINITGTVRWQSCDHHTCHIPRTEAFSITVPVGAPNVPSRMGKVG